jgi:hypothetical protein
MGQGDVPTSRGGPLRRRREKRQLEHLAVTSERDGAPRPPAAAHVKVIEDREPPPAKAASGESEEVDPSVDGAPLPRPGGFHVRAVPIDQPVGD